MLTRAELVEHLENLQLIIGAWRESEEPQLYDQHGRKRIAQVVEDGFTVLFELTRTDQVQEDARELVLLCDHFERCVCDWASSFNANRISDGRIADPGGTFEMWTAFDHIVAKIPVHKPAPPLPIRILMDQNVREPQICRIYGFLDDEGNPDMRTFLEECENPGTHYDPATWVAPATKKRQRQIAEQWPRHLDHLESQGWAKYAQPVEMGDDSDEPARGEHVAPETLEELVRQRVSVRQIMLMRPHDAPDVTEEQIRQVASDLGVALEGAVHTTVNEAANARDKARLEAQERSMEVMDLNTHPELATQEERVQAMHADGVSNKQISEALRVAFPKISTQKVTSILKQAKEAAPA